MAKMKIKKGDTVQVITGKDKGQVGEVVAVDLERQRVTVAGVARVTKHVKPGTGGEEGGLVVTEAALHVSNVALVDPADNKPTRTKTRVEVVEKDGRSKTVRTRISARSGKEL